jgi:ribokinase
MGVCVQGSLNLDIVCSVAELPAPGETISARGVRHFAGGKGLNQAMAAARWGAVTAMIGAVGADEAGGELRAALEAAGVDTSGVSELAGAPTGHGYIFVSAAGENMIVVAGGANLILPPAPAPSACKVLLCQLETPVASTAAFFAGAPAAALKILNAAPALAEGAALFPLADIIVVNETELARFAGARTAPTALEQIAPLARRLISRSGQSVVVTLGAAGAAAIAAGEAYMVAGRPAAVVDTTGAGDCFCGVLAAALDEGASLAEAMVFANAAAALSTQTHGAAVSMPTRAAAEAFIAA